MAERGAIRWALEESLEAMARAWLARLITRRERPENFAQALERRPEDIKVVIPFSEV